MNQNIDILIGDFNFFSHINLTRKNLGYEAAYTLSLEYSRTIKKTRAIKRIKSLISNWKKINDAKKIKAENIMEYLEDLEEIFWNVI